MNRSLDGEQELIVVDNASTERPRAEAAAWKGSGRLIELERNVGFGAASNAGVAEATGEATVLLNPDTELLDDGLDRLAAAVARARRPGRPARAQPRRLGPALGQRPGGRRLAVGAGARPRRDPARGAPRPHRAVPARAPLDVSWLTGCLRRGADRAARAGSGRSTRRCTCSARTSTSACAPAAAGVRSRFDPAACRIVHHGQGSSTDRLRLARGLAPDRHAQLARRRPPRLRAAARVARLAGAAAQPAPAAARQARPRTGDTARPRRGRGGASRPGPCRRPRDRTPRQRPGVADYRHIAGGADLGPVAAHCYTK